MMNLLRMSAAGGASGEIVFAPRLNKKFSNEKLFRSNFETCVPAKGVDSAAP